MNCNRCKFNIDGKCTYPKRIPIEDYIIEDGKIKGCKYGR